MEFLSDLLSIFAINIVLSGDNAVVIGLAAHGLSPEHRRIAIIGGGLAAVVLRLILTGAATVLLQVPALKAVGAILLVCIAFKLLREEEEEHEGKPAPDSLSVAIRTILVADFIMSLDNVLGVAAVARGSIILLSAGLLLSIPVIMLAGAFIAQLLDRLWWLSYLGCGLIAWTAADMLLDDELVHSTAAQLGLLPAAVGSHDIMQIVIFPLLITVVTVAASHYFHRHLPRTRAVRPA